jgi:putative sterol carrier protein
MDDPGITEADGDAQCVIKMAAEDFVELVESRADARQYLFMGKLRIDGNVGMAIKLRKFTDMFRDDE